MNEGSFMAVALKRPDAEHLREPEQISIRVLHQEFTLPRFLLADAIPSVFRRPKQWPGRTLQCCDQRCYVSDKDHEVDATTERPLKCTGFPDAIAEFEHNLRAI